MSKYSNILIVCTGNTCRSPMAVGLLRQALKKQPGIEISSAGVLAGNGAKASRNAIEVMREENVDISEHQSQSLTKDMIAATDMVLVMTNVHKLEVIHLLDNPGKEIYLLKDFSDDKDKTDLDISDPIGRSIAIYRECRNEIKSCLPRLVRRILGENL